MNIPNTALELSKLLNTSPSNLRQRLSEANGQINFNPETDELTPGQLAIWLPRYVAEGTKTYFKDEQKRATVYELLAQLNGNGGAMQTTTERNGRTEQKVMELPMERQMQKARPKQSKLDAFIALLPILPLPTLGIAASWGVFHFADVFSPMPIAIFEAIGFELVYIGLSTLRDVPDKFRKYRQYVSLGAVGVSVVYNSLSAWLVLQPDLFTGLHFGWQIAVSIAHGLPIALLGYFVADLISIVKSNQK
jgi:hypothetical protein